KRPQQKKPRSGRGGALSLGDSNALSVSALVRPFYDRLGSMLCAPIPHSLRSNSPIRTDDAINGITFGQLRTGIPLGRLFGRLTAPRVALIDFTMHDPSGKRPV